MDLHEVVTRLGLTDSIDKLRPEWEVSQQFLSPGELPFFAPEYAAQACRDVYLSEEIAQAAAAACRRLAGDPAVRALAWYYHHCLYHAANRPDFGWITDWPSLDGSLGDDAGLFHLLVLLSGVPGMKAVHQTHGLPQDVIRDTLLDITYWLEHERRRNGRSGWGLTPHNLAWLSNHLRGEVYRLVRLQFQFASFWPKLRVFRHRPSGTVLALSEDGVRYRSDGERLRDDDPDSAGAWTARFAQTEDHIVGQPILPTGQALPRELVLPTAEWRQVLGPGDPALNLHIPGGGPLTHSDCGESFRRALDFFPRYFPERPFLGLCCGSWILDRGLEELLPPSSNLLRFQREVYLFPIGLSSYGLFDRVFGGRPRDLTRAPRDTALRRAVVDRLLSGGQLNPRAGGCFLLPEDLNWGSQIYRRQRLDWVLGDPVDPPAAPDPARPQE